MSERIALVTGSSRGIGRNIALHLAKVASGAAIHFHTNSEAAESAVTLIKEKGAHSRAFRADLLDEKQVVQLIHRVEREFGRLDILVNNFGPILVKRWTELTTEDWRLTIGANLESAFLCTKAALPGMRKRKWGRVINIGYSRVEQLTAFSKIIPYAVAKTGLLILTRSMAVSEAKHGITVNMVSPGLMEGGALPEERKVPAGRLGQFADISQAVLFLVSEDASYITGNNVIVAGGWKL